MRIRKKRGKKQGRERKLSVLQQFSSFFFTRAKLTLVLLAALLVGGGYVYSSVIEREGFPPVQFPLSIVSGQYFVDDANRVDQDVAQPLDEVIGAVEGVTEVRSTAGTNFYQIVVFYEEDIDADTGTERIKQAVQEANMLPAQTTSSFQSIKPAKFLNQYDLLLSVYGKDGPSAEQLEEVAASVSERIQDNELVETAELQQLVTIAQNPATGINEERQTAFSRIGVQEDDALQFYPAVSIGINRVEGSDIIELSESVQASIDGLDMTQFEGEFAVTRSADFADTVNGQIDSLQNNLLSGLIAVSLVSLLLITWRASIITAIFMVAVMATVILILWAVGYTLNTITLFGLVLALGLFVDDATIVVEAIDASRSSKKKKKEVVLYAVQRVAAASMSGTLTTVFVFLPLAFVSGILGEFIRLLPITVILALLSSLVLSLSIIPVLSKYILLRSSKKQSKLARYNPFSWAEEYLGEKLSRLPLLFEHSRKKAVAVASVAVALSIVFVMGAGYFASRVSFNIFPPTKDSDQLAYTISFTPGTTIQEAQEITDTVNDVIKEEAGSHLRRIAFGRSSQPNERSADALIELVSYNDREPTSAELKEQLQAAVAEAIPTSEASVRVIQIDAGSPAEEYPFKMQVYGEDVAQLTAFTDSVQEDLQNEEITLANGETATVTATKVENVQTIVRDDGARFIELQAAYDSEDTSALVEATQTTLEERFTDDVYAQYGLAEEDVTFDFGQESDNADSFASLAIAFPIAIGLMYVLLAFQFRSLAQPLLIFIAIPFSLFGVFAGLYFTDTPLSFLVQVGLIGLIGIAVNNSIMLTDYANQERRSGKTVYQAISEATKLRFRPLLATTITTVVALTPLALADPFWEPLALTIIFGLLSSTLLIIVAFPYYYLIFESLRHKSIVKLALLWCVGLVVGFALVGGNAAAIVFVALYALVTFALKRFWKRARA